MSTGFLGTIADCCTLANKTDGSGPWTIHIEPDGEVQILLRDEDGDVEYMECWPVDGPPHRGKWAGKGRPGVIVVDGTEYQVTWTKFAGLYKDVTGRVWAIPDVVGVHAHDPGPIIAAGNTYWLLLVGSYDPRVARLPRHVGSITSPTLQELTAQAVATMPDELLPLFKEMQEIGQVPLLMWKGE